MRNYYYCVFVLFVPLYYDMFGKVRNDLSHVYWPETMIS